MTLGELGLYFQRFCGVSCELEVLRCQGWNRESWFDATGLPWIYPSPNMPTLDTATVYPGMCMIEATNLSEGRGTTRPFHLFGAPWIDPNALTAACEHSARRAGLSGVGFRPAAFEPGFQKHAGARCGGVEVHVLDRDVLDATLLGLVAVEAGRAVNPDMFAWRAEPYEFISDPPAIDLLTGNSEFRTALEVGSSIRTVYEGWETSLAGFRERRAEVLLYP